MRSRSNGKRNDEHGSGMRNCRNWKRSDKLTNSKKSDEQRKEFCKNGLGVSVLPRKVGSGMRNSADWTRNDLR